ncbi:MAG TPA: SH3 domain-containing protein [Xanthobacteraceae bacterium]|nr:SH3 domain-containing protein [Xanthobacteraceae bacterium]
MTLRRKLLTSAGLLVVSTGIALAAPAVVESAVNLRAGPGVDFPVITSMQAGTPVNVIGCGENWCRVAFGGTVGFADRDFLALGGRVGPPSVTVGSSYGYEGPGYAGYETGRYSYGATPGYTHGYGSTAYSSYRGSYGTYGNESRRERVETRTRSDEPRTAAELKGDNPMKNYKSTANPNLRRSEQQSAEIKGDNPMKNYKSTANPNLRAAEPPAAIKGNNPMKMPPRSTATNERGTRRSGETTGAAPKDERHY